MDPTEAGREQLLDRIAERCNPMVARWKMRELHRLVADRPEVRMVVEVGAGHGALTFLLADAIRRGGAGGRIIAFERIVGGSRGQYGDFGANARIIHENIRHFSAEDVVEFILADVADEHGHIPDDQRIDLLLVDADGRVDREFLLFWARLSPTALIVLDDARGDLTLGGATVLPRLRRTFWVDGKSTVTEHIVRRMENDGFLEPVADLGDVRVLRRTADAPDALRPEYFLEVYRSLLPRSARLPGRGLALTLPSVRGIALVLIRRTRLGRWAYDRYRGRP